jgi:hypothetical protein
MQTTLGNKTRLNIPTPQLLICPNCSFRLDRDLKECPSCGIVLSKHLDYIPTKVFNEGPLSTEEISDIRKIKEKLENPNAKKQIFEILLHCNKEGLLDLAAHHIRDYKEESGRLAIKTLLKRYSLLPFDSKRTNFLNWITRPFTLLFLLIMTGLIFLTVMLRFHG